MKLDLICKTAKIKLQSLSNNILAHIVYLTPERLCFLVSYKRSQLATAFLANFTLLLSEISRSSFIQSVSVNALA